MVKSYLVHTVNSASANISWSMRNWDVTLNLNCFPSSCYLVTLICFYPLCHICINIYETEKDKFLYILWACFYDYPLSICTVIIFRMDQSCPQLSAWVTYLPIHQVPCLVFTNIHLLWFYLQLLKWDFFPNLNTLHRCRRISFWCYCVIESGLSKCKLEQTP